MVVKTSGSQNSNGPGFNSQQFQHTYLLYKIITYNYCRFVLLHFLGSIHPGHNALVDYIIKVWVMWFKMYKNINNYSCYIKFSDKPSWT